MTVDYHLYQIVKLDLVYIKSNERNTLYIYIYLFIVDVCVLLYFFGYHINRYFEILYQKNMFNLCIFSVYGVAVVCSTSIYLFCRLNSNLTYVYFCAMGRGGAKGKPRAKAVLFMSPAQP